MRREINAGSNEYYKIETTGHTVIASDGPQTGILGGLLDEMDEIPSNGTRVATGIGLPDPAYRGPTARSSGATSPLPFF